MEAGLDSLATTELLGQLQRAVGEAVLLPSTLVFEAPESERNPHLLLPIFYEADFLLSEQDLVSSLLIITGTEQKVVYFVTGHGERDIYDTEVGGAGFGLVRNGLVGDNYQVDTINLKQSAAVPEDSAVLVIAGPETGFLNDELDAIETYLRGGGSLLVLADAAGAPDINKLLNRWGLGLLEGTVVDITNSPVGDPRSPIVRRGQYNPENPVTRPLDDTFFTEVAAIEDVIKKAPEGLPPNPDELNINLIPLARTSIFSCITTDRDRSDCGAEEDVPGPHTIAIMVEALAPVGEDAVDITQGDDVTLASLVVIGDSDFASNEFFFAFSNGDLVLNAVDWLAQKYELISIRAKPSAFRQLIITQREFDFIRYSSWFLMPAGVILLAGIAWWRRR